MTGYIAIPMPMPGSFSTPMPFAEAPSIEAAAEQFCGKDAIESTSETGTHSLRVFLKNGSVVNVVQVKAVDRP